MRKKTWLRIWAVVTLIRIVLALPFAAGEHELELNCDNVLKEKLDDCKYILNSDFNEEEKQDLIDILNSQSYSYEYNWEAVEEIPQSETKTQEIDNDTILFAWDVAVLIFFNYFVYSVLTKSSFFEKWLNVVS
ncbi:hypothetical protein HYV49_04925 [Candidatus Pacearchaeota archaeon]|nr:hypothetical protein [Candidatus Pacearchaeota archaeon]